MANGIKKVKGKASKKSLNFAVNMHRILKEVAPNSSITQQTMQIANALAVDLFDRLITTAETVRAYDEKNTLSAKHVQAATKVLMRPELAQHAVMNGTNAVKRFQEYEK